jgi:hypothetical protein
LKRKSKKKNKVEIKETPKRRGRPPKVKVELPVSPVNKRKRGRPRKLVGMPEIPQVKDKLAAFRKPIKAVTKSKAVKMDIIPKTAEERIIENHPLYTAAKWLQSNIPQAEEEYIKKQSRKTGAPTINTIMEHMLGYFQVKGSEIGLTLKSTHKQP